MKTIILNEPGSFTLTERDHPGDPSPGEALIKIHRVGICGTDLHAYRGRQPFFSYPRILGHELGVEIVALGRDTANLGLTVGDACAIEAYLNCGTCSACRRGRTNCCESLKVLGVHIDGGMQEYYRLPADKLIKSTLPYEHLATVEMLSIGAHAVSRAQPQPDENVLVVGAGPIGLGAIQFARLTGANVAVMEISPKRMSFCQENIGIENFINGKSEDVVANLRSLFGGELPTTVFDATGNVHSMNNTFNLVEQAGQIVFISLVQDNITFFDPEFHRREVTLKSSRNATRQDFDSVVQALEEKKIKIEPWITHHATPETMLNEFESWLDPETGVVKAMLAFE
ncbi:MAG: zinc-binding alcohol dehydrogenase family protein [Chloroflexota bacterium]